MMEDEARSEVERQLGNARTETIARFLAMVAEETRVQNLVSPSTVSAMWNRHALDSVQLLELAEGHEGLWLDIGTGGGFPGMVVAIGRQAPVVLVEPRRRRAEFLRASAERLQLAHVSVIQSRIETAGVRGAAIISARAVASIENLLQAARPCGTQITRWLLPRGRIDPDDLTALRGRGMFHVEQSVTDPSSSILVLNGVFA